MDEVGRQTAKVVRHFNDALNAHDIDGVMALMTDDCVFEDTEPAPDGTRYEGAAAVRKFWEKLLADSPQARFAEEDLIACADRCVVRWRYDWGDGHVRGVDVMRVRAGKVSEKLYAFVVPGRPSASRLISTRWLYAWLYRPRHESLQSLPKQPRASTLKSSTNSRARRRSRYIGLTSWK